MSARWYYETVSPEGRWMPHLAETRPETVIHGGHLRLQPASGKGLGPRIRALSSIHPGLADRSVEELQAILSPDINGAAVNPPNPGAAA
ncbi:MULTISPECIES: hypothetical protein [Rhodobacterales]|uniref:hypothetical protein n=1 Tax=Rhodobacterales TaxID=204455 RepID=UPI000899FAB8|nr:MULTISPECIES: hypothetical protein [Paracoccaceae]SEB78150.1 hypothetical protein SAMN05519105_1296 [Rhodobacter sp. 24-YEA-8]